MGSKRRTAIQGRVHREVGGDPRGPREVPGLLGAQSWSEPVLRADTWSGLHGTGNWSSLPTDLTILTEWPEGMRSGECRRHARRWVSLLLYDPGERTAAVADLVLSDVIQVLSRVRVLLVSWRSLQVAILYQHDESTIHTSCWCCVARSWLCP